MSFSCRVPAQRQRLFARLALSGVVAAILVPSAPAFAKSHEDQQRAWLPSAPVEVFAGEIIYEFDSALNKTKATFVAPLGKVDLVHRLFFPPPTVHTITATYQFSSRFASHVPDTVRVLLQSDEYTAATSAGEVGTLGDVTMTIGIGQLAVQHSLSVSQRTELDLSPRRMPIRTSFTTGSLQEVRQPQINQVHISRKATAWFPICEFLSLIDQPEIQGTVGGLDFSVNRPVVTGLRLFAAQMLPDGTDERSIDCTHR